MTNARTTRGWGRAALVMVAVAGSWGLAHWWRSDGPGTREVLVGRVWLDRLPRDPRDMIRQLVLLREPALGVTARASRWRFAGEAFEWKLDGDRRLTTHFPQDGRRASFEVRAWACAGEAPKPFELCLEVARGARKIRLYSRKEWVVDGAGRRDVEIGWLAPLWDLRPGPAPQGGQDAPPDWLPFD
jgi:hypothetical protein